MTAAFLEAVRRLHVVPHGVHTGAFESAPELGHAARRVVVAKQTSLIPFGQFSLMHLTPRLASELAREFVRARESQLGHISRE